MRSVRTRVGSTKCAPGASRDFLGTRGPSGSCRSVIGRRHDRFGTTYTLLGAPPSCFPRCRQTYPIRDSRSPGSNRHWDSTSPGRTAKVLPAEVAFNFFTARSKQPRPLLPDWLPRTAKRSAAVLGGPRSRRDRTAKYQLPSWTSHKQSAISVIFDPTPRRTLLPPQRPRTDLAFTSD